jgi:lauroyl/myristoyl acyltransferase
MRIPWRIGWLTGGTMTVTNKTQQTSISAPQDPNWTPHLGRARLHPKDFLLLAYIPAITLIAWLLPERLWGDVCNGAAHFLMTLRRSRTRSYYRKLNEILGSRLTALDVKEILACFLAKNHLARVQGMRCHAPGGWSPPIRFEGQEHIELALAAGKGAILWIAPMASKDLITKMALHRAGYRVSHLSRFDHGFSISLWGARLFNPLWTRIEERFLAERLVMSAATQVGPLRLLIKRLHDNGLVSVTANHEGRKYPHTAPFLSGTIRLAEGAPSLSLATGAALLPVFTVREPDGMYVTKIEPALVSVTGGKPAQEIGSLTAQFVRLLESYTLRFPCDFQGWGLCGV